MPRSCAQRKDEDAQLRGQAASGAYLDQREFKGARYERDQNLVVVVVGLGVWIVYGVVMER